MFKWAVICCCAKARSSHVARIFLYKEILIKILESETVEVFFPNIYLDLQQMVESTCYMALMRIQSIKKDESLADPECFGKIEEVLCVLEDLGSHGGDRHDF